MVATEEEITTAENSFPPGYAAGPHSLKPMVFCGEILDFTCACYFGASQCALSKTEDYVYSYKDGGIRSRNKGMRPVVNGLRYHLRPIQLGFGTTSICEAAQHDTQSNVNICQGKCALVKSDKKDTSNCIRRDVFF